MEENHISCPWEKKLTEDICIIYVLCEHDVEEIVKNLFDYSPSSKDIKRLRADLKHAIQKATVEFLSQRMNVENVDPGAEKSKPRTARNKYDRYWEPTKQTGHGIPEDAN